MFLGGGDVESRDQGAGFLLINPLHAVAPIPQQEASPYLPATRRFRNPIYLRVAEVLVANLLVFGACVVALLLVVVIVD